MRERKGRHRRGRVKEKKRKKITTCCNAVNCNQCSLQENNQWQKSLIQEVHRVNSNGVVTSFYILAHSQDYAMRCGKWRCIIRRDQWNRSIRNYLVALPNVAVGIQLAICKEGEKKMKRTRKVKEKGKRRVKSTCPLLIQQETQNS